MKTPSYYAVIPANVRYDNELSTGSRLLYGEITALSEKEGYCWASNAYFADLYKVSKDTISRWISELNNKYINVEINNENGNFERKIYMAQNGSPSANKSRDLDINAKGSLGIDADIVLQDISNTKNKEKTKVFSSFLKRTPTPKKRFGYNESDPGDDLPSVDLETGEIDEKKDKKTSTPKNRLALDAQAYFERACERATGTKPLKNVKGYHLIISVISKGKFEARDLRKRIDDWFASGKPVEKLVQITHCFSNYEINDWLVKNPL